ncbi:hypothetical protein ACHAWF_015659 [Thalassiosira exigua]
MSDLVARIVAENQARAKRAHLEVLEAIPYFPDAGKAEEDAGGDVGESAPNAEVSNEEWSNRARAVTGPHDALYTDPTSVPGYEEHNRTFLELAPRIKECIKRRNETMAARWESLATQYVARQAAYNDDLGDDTEVSERGGYFSAAALLRDANDGGGASLAIDGSSSPAASSSAAAAPSARGNNPYRRPRRGISLGDVVRSDYEQEQIIAEIAAKEAMEKRIKEGGCALPRQRVWLEGRVKDPMAVEEEMRHINIWSDMEKCIFLDRFLHHPKDFRKIASFLRNKTTKDCIRFYYDSKKTVPYKHALKEFLQRKKRRDATQVSWDATIQACLAMGAVIKAGGSPEKPLKFILPESDFTYHTRNFHPMRLEVFHALEESVMNAKQPDEIKVHAGKRKRSNWFILDAHEKKYLKHAETSEDHHSSKRKAATREVTVANPESEEKEDHRNAHHKSGEDVTPREEKKQLPQKWKEKEKKLFYQALDKHGKFFLSYRARQG